MKSTILIVCSVLLCGSVACRQTRPFMARADLYNAQGQHVGKATLTEVKEGVKIAIEVFKLPPGQHGFHIHEVGTCNPPDFKSAGGHFNPYGKKHGQKNPAGAHAGDMPNLVVGPDSTGKAEVIATHVTLGSGEHSLFHPGGTCLVIHANPDDEMTDPAGNSGLRIACGVITREKE